MPNAMAAQSCRPVDWRSTHWSRAWTRRPVSSFGSPTTSIAKKVPPDDSGTVRPSESRFVIMDEMRRTGRVAIGIRRLARETNFAKNTVTQAIKAIEESGVLVVERRGRGQRLRFRLPTVSVAGIETPRNSTGVARTETECLKICDTSGSGTATRPDQTPSQTEGGRASASQKLTKAKTLKSRSAHHEVIRYFTDGWSKRHNGAKYTFANGRDGKAVKFVLEAADGDLDRAIAFVDRYLEDDDFYIIRQEHPLALIQTRLSKYAAQVAKATSTTIQPVADHPLIRDAIERFGPDAVEVHRRELDAIVERVECGGLPERRSRAVMRSTNDVAAFVAEFKTAEAVSHAG